MVIRSACGSKTLHGVARKTARSVEHVMVVSN